MQLANKIKVNVNIGLLEDEKWILDDMYDGMKESLVNFNEICLNQLLAERSDCPITIVPQLKKMDNLAEARRFVHSGGCDVLLADYKVKEKETTAKDTVTILPLLYEIKNKRASIPVIGHTAYPEIVEEIATKDLTTETISKGQPKSVIRLIDRGLELSKMIGSYKGDLFGALAELKEALTLPSPIDKQDAIHCAKLLLANIKPSVYAPYDYREAIVILRSLLFRISSIPSETFMLRGLSIDFIEIIEPLFQKLGGPFFSYERDAVPTLMQLEAHGYNVIMRIDDEQE